MPDSEAELKCRMFSWPLFPNLEDYLSLFIVNVKNKADLYNGKFAYHPLVPVVSDIIDTELDVPLQFLAKVILHLSRVVVNAFNNFKDRYGLVFFHEKKINSKIYKKSYD
jgi:hypothetical protein